MEAVAQFQTSVSFIATSAASRFRTLRVSDEKHTRRPYLPSCLNRVDLKRSGINLRKDSLLPVFSGDEETPDKDPAKSSQSPASKVMDGGPVASSQQDRGRGDINKQTPSPERDPSAELWREEPRGQLLKIFQAAERRANPQGKAKFTTGRGVG